MKETFKSFVELLISVALDADVMITLERENGKDIRSTQFDDWLILDLQEVDQSQAVPVTGQHWVPDLQFSSEGLFCEKIFSAKAHQHKVGQEQWNV